MGPNLLLVSILILSALGLNCLDGIQNSNLTSVGDKVEIMEKMFRSSGKFLNDLGRYLDCVNIPEAQYFLISQRIVSFNEANYTQLVTFNTTFSKFIYGLCLPSGCTE